MGGSSCLRGTRTNSSRFRKNDPADPRRRAFGRAVAGCAGCNKLAVGLYAPFVPADALGAPLEKNIRARWGAWPKDRIIHVAVEHDSLVGFAAVELSRIPLLDCLHVDLARRSCGVAEPLMRVVEEHLIARGYLSIRLDVIAGNAATRLFYVRLGGRRVRLRWIRCWVMRSRWCRSTGLTCVRCLNWPARGGQILAKCRSTWQMPLSCTPGWKSRRYRRSLPNPPVRLAA